jgi:hypothetical protein
VYIPKMFSDVLLKKLKHQGLMHYKSDCTTCVHVCREGFKVATSVKICRETGHLNFSYLQKVYQRKVYLAGFIYDLYLYSTYNKMISSPLSTYIAVKVNSDETLKSVRYIGIKRNIIIY